MLNFATAHSFWNVINAGIKMKTAITSALYKKSLKLSARGKAKSSTGEMINLMANDTERLLFASVSFNMAFSTPILVIGALVVIAGMLGYNLYQAKKQPEGLQINVGPDGLKIQNK